MTSEEGPSTGGPSSTEGATVATYNADDVSNKPTGVVKGASKPTTTTADWVPEAKVVEAPVKTAPKKQSRASKK